MSASVTPTAEGADLHYVHEQSVAATVWVVSHGLGKKVSVTVVDSADTAIIGDVQYIDDNTVQLEFSAPFGGRAYCN